MWNEVSDLHRKMQRMIFLASISMTERKRIVEPHHRPSRWSTVIKTTLLLEGCGFDARPERTEDLDHGPQCHPAWHSGILRVRSPSDSRSFLTAVYCSASVDDGTNVKTCKVHVLQDLTVIRGLLYCQWYIIYSSAAKRFFTFTHSFSVSLATSVFNDLVSACWCSDCCADGRH